MRSDGGAAFPIASDGDVLHDATFQDGRMSGGEWKARSPGMSLRDYFAAAALQGMVAALADPAYKPGSEIYEKEIAESCYELANAMLAERDKP